MKITIDTNPEFGNELVLTLPYAYWLFQNNKLEKVITSKGMKPFYYFFDNVEEKHNHRTIDNSASGINNLPNNWLHHNSQAVIGKDYGDLNDSEKYIVNGALDYRQWTPPPLLEHYKNDKMKFDKPFVVIANKFTIEHGEYPVGFFNLKCLIEMFNYFKEKNYYVVYIRPSNREFPIDQNDVNSIANNIDYKDTLDGNIMTDFDLIKNYENVIPFIDIVNNNLGESYDANLYNILQIKLFCNTEGFITPSGGGGILCSYFGKDTLIYATHSGELRPGYFSDNSYYKKLSNADLHLVYDDNKEIRKRGYNNYTDLIKKMKDIF